MSKVKTKAGNKDTSYLQRDYDTLHEMWKESERVNAALRAEVERVTKNDQYHRRWIGEMVEELETLRAELARRQKLLDSLGLSEAVLDGLVKPNGVDDAR